MCQLVQDGVAAALVHAARHLGGEDVLVAEGHAASVFHRTHVVFGAEHLVVLDEGVRHAEVLVVVVEALLGFAENLLGVKGVR